MWDSCEYLRRSTRALTSSGGSSKVIYQDRLDVLTGRLASRVEGVGWGLLMGVCFVRSMGTILGSVYFQLVTKRPLGSFPFDFLSLGVGKGRGQDSNLQSSGHEPDESTNSSTPLLPLLFLVVVVLFLVVVE
ncbi:unnamed protein product [Prunus armeniaca]